MVDQELGHTWSQTRPAPLGGGEREGAGDRRGGDSPTMPLTAPSRAVERLGDRPFDGDGHDRPAAQYRGLDDDRGQVRTMLAADRDGGTPSE